MKQYGRTRLILNIYIAVIVTVLGVLILNSVGTNNEQNRRIAQQARALANRSAIADFKGCQRGNYVRGKINTISGALSTLLHKSVEESEKIKPLTPEQQEFLDEEFELLRPLNKTNCEKKYPHGRALQANSP